MSTAALKFVSPNVELSQLEAEDLQYFSEKIKALAGIHITSSKKDLVRTRLRTRLLELGLESYSEYRECLKKLKPCDPEWQVFTNLLTTNKTDFFREPAHFDFLIEKIIPEWLTKNKREFKVWSAASSTGEEAYTLSMVLDHALPKGYSYKIFASDIDTKVIQRASNAVYPKTKLVEIPEEYQKSSIDLGQGNVSAWFRLKKHLKDNATFAQHNLISEKIPSEAPFDLILCRNVLIYFEPKTIQAIQEKLFQATAQGGYLFIGHSESFQGLQHQWKPMAASIFKKP